MYMYTKSDHTFVVCAYKESPYLEECLQSITSQEVQSNVLISTSTPNDYICALAQKYDVPLFENGSAPGIGSDWNAAISHATTPLVTIAHQDDTYDASYVRCMLELVNKAQTPLIYFTNYGEIRNGMKVDKNQLLNVKRKMLAPLKDGKKMGSKFVRRRILSFGSAICCPSVTMCIPNIDHPVFLTDMKCNLDWQAWERASRLEGDFLYDSRILMHHRIHEESETTNLIHDNTRSREDLEMYKKFWPAPFAHALCKVYSISQNSNSKK